MSEAQTYATGKRKTAVARVWISAGSGLITVNGKTIDEYFERETGRMIEERTRKTGHTHHDRPSAGESQRTSCVMA